LGGVLVTTAAALTTAVLNHRWQREGVQQERINERTRELRQERREAYSRYWTKATSLLRYLEHAASGSQTVTRAHLADFRAQRIELDEAAGIAYLVSPSDITQGIIDTQVAFDDVFDNLPAEHERYKDSFEALAEKFGTVVHKMNGTLTDP
jgi:hypothetical protein